MDLPAEFYLETVQHIFMDHDLPRGELKYRGRGDQAGAIKKTFVLTVEGERTTSAGSARPRRRSICAPGCGRC